MKIALGRAATHRETLRSVTTPAKKLGRQIAARRGELGVSQEELGRMMRGNGLSTIKRLEQCALYGGQEPGRPRATTMAAIDRALGWTHGSAAGVWDGTRPPHVADADVADAPLVIEHADDDTRALFALLGDEALTEEERQQALKAAVAVVRALRGATSP